MASFSNRLRYVTSKAVYSYSLYEKIHGPVDSKSIDTILKTFLTGKLTFMYRTDERPPPIGTEAGTFLVRGIPKADPTNTFVGDLVLLRDPTSTSKFLIRRIAAVEGHEIVSTDEKDKPFVLGKNKCWVVTDSGAIKTGFFNDSRSFGPLDMKEIIGRAIYMLVNDVEHGAVKNSHLSSTSDRPVLEMELDIDEMKKEHGL